MALSKGILYIVGLAVLLVLAYYVFDKLNTVVSNEQLKLEDEIQVSPPTGAVDEQTGEVDQNSFEQNQQISENNDLETIELELNNTILLEEDFSDL